MSNLYLSSGKYFSMMVAIRLCELVKESVDLYVLTGLPISGSG